MVSEVICYRGKSALREVGKVFGLSVEQVNRLSSALSYWDTAEEAQGRMRSLGLDQNSEQLLQVLHLAKALQGTPRHLSIHVGGFVLSAKPLYEVAPVEPGRMEGRTVIPWDKDDLEALGFFKIDVLGLGMLTAVRKALALIHPLDSSLDCARDSLRAGPCDTLPCDTLPFDPIDALARVPGEDPAAYMLACKADTIGVFQIESRAQMAMLPRLRPQCFYDLVIEVALVRPGPIQGGMVHPYLRRRNGEEEINAPHPDLWPILERTLGVPLFQEQVMQLAIVGAGYSGGQADQLRRDMAAWKKTGRLLRHRERLLQGFKQKGIAEEFAERLFEQIKGFGDYGFPESHAASFALLAYISLWLKAHFPAHFACALLNSQPMGFYSSRVLVSDAVQHGVTVKPLHVNHSDWDCTLEDGALRLGFRVLKCLSQSAAKQIIAARQEGQFADLDDFVWRTRIPRNQQEALAEAGAFEGLSPSRRQALWGIRAPRVTGLFTGVAAREATIRLRPMDKVETLMVDYQRTGISIADHPMRHLRTQLAKRKVIPARDLKNIGNGAQVSVAGLVQARQRPGTASGVVFITLEDETGVSNLVLWSSIFERFRPIAQHAMLMLAKGRLELQVTAMKPGEVGEATPVIHVIVQELERLELPGGTMAVTSRDFH
jgi:error-prone DNA polymerase